MRTKTVSHITSSHIPSSHFISICIKDIILSTIMGGFISLAFLAPVTAADFSGNLKEVSITDSAGTNIPPKAAFVYSINGNTVTFDASDSFDSDGSLIKYKWSFGDGSSGEGISAIHQYTSLSSIPVTLTVMDDKNGVSITQQTIAEAASFWLAETFGKSKWTLVYVDSQEITGENGAATNAFDNTPSTIWHTAWSTYSPMPHEIQIDLNNNFTVSGFRYLPRQSGENGRVCDYEFYVSDDINNWGTPVSVGTLTNTFDQKEVTFTNKQGRYVRFRAIRECNNNAWASMAEIDFQVK